MASEEHAQEGKEALGTIPLDTAALESLAKSQAALAEKLSAVAIEAAQRSTDLSARWVQDALSKLSTLTQAKAEPAEYAKAVTDFMAGSAEAATENLAAFADIAKTVQAETLALLLAAGQSAPEDATAAAKKATKGSGGSRSAKR